MPSTGGNRLGAVGKDIFVVAHPDDAEVMFGYRIIRSPNPSVIVATDGMASTVDRIGGGFVLSGRRRDESRCGLESCGVPPNQQHYLSLPDGKVSEHIPQVRDAILEMVGSCSL